MNSEKLKSMSQRLHEHFESEEGKASVKEFVERIEHQNKIKDLQVLRFHEKYGDKLDQVIERIMAKYESSAYKEKEMFKLGYEPRKPLYSLLYRYAEKYGKQTKAQKHLSGFNDVAYYIGSYVIRILHGQGSHCQIYKR